tara:strand:+ start:2513 stop:4219 length:1707 start_codon:yes stop_codon:yes gene_type:complete
MAVFYVSAQTGNDSNGGDSPTAAFASLQAGLDAMASAGDIVYIAPGIYRGIFDMNSAVNGNSTANNKIVGDPDCEIFTAEKKGVVRLTNTDENDINAQTTTSGTNRYVLYVSKLRTEVHNLHVDGGGNDFSSDSKQRTLTYSFGIAGASDGYYNAYNCICQMLAYGYYRMGTTNCIAISTIYGFYQGYKHVHSLAVAGYAGFYLCDYAVDCVSIGSYVANFWNCDHVCNGFALSGGYGVRGSNNLDVVHDTVFLGTAFGVYGQSQGSSGLEISGSYIGSGFNAVFKGNISNTIFGGGILRLQSTTANYPNATDFSISDGDNGCKVGANVLYSYNGARKFIEAAKPTLLNHVLRGKSSNHHDSDRNYSISAASRIPVTHEHVETDILGHPREMGIATHSLHNQSGHTTARDLGAYEYSTVDYTGSYSQSEEAIVINGEGIQSFYVPVLSGSALTASVNVRWNYDGYTGDVDTSHTPGIVIKYATGHSSSSYYTNQTLQQYQTGSQLIVSQSFTSVGAHTWDNVYLPIPPSDKNQIYDIQLKARATASRVDDHPSSGSLANAVFSDLEIT